MTSKILDAFLQENLEDLKDRGLYNVIDPLESPNGPIIKINGREPINLSSNNYLGLATDERLKSLQSKQLKNMGLEQVLSARSMEHLSFTRN